MASLSPLVLKLTANAGPMESALKAAQQKIQQFATSGPIGTINSTLSNLFSKIPGGGVVQQALGGLGDMATKLLGSVPLIGPHLASLAAAMGPVGVGATLVTAGLVGLATAGFAAIGSMKDFSETFGLTADAAYGLAFAFQRIGQDTSEAESSLVRFTSNLGAIRDNPTGPLAKELEQLGVNAQALADLPIDQALGMAADAFNQLENAADRARLGQQLFGKGWVTMRELLSGGSAGLARAADMSRVLGLTLSEVDFELADKGGKAVKRAWAAVASVFASTANAVAVSAAPAVIAVSDAIERLIVGLQPAMQIVRDVMGTVVTVFGLFATAGVAAFSILFPVLDGVLKLLGSLWNVISAVVNLVAAPFVAAFQALTGAANAGLSPLSILGDILGIVAAGINFVATAIKSLASLIAGTVLAAVQALVATFGSMASFLARLPVIGNAFAGMASGAESAVQRIQALRDSLNQTSEAGAQLADQAERQARRAEINALDADVNKAAEQIRQQVADFGLSDIDKQIRNLELRGADSKAIDMIRNEQAMLDMLEREAALRERINQTVQAMATPVDQFQTGFLDVMEQLEGGLNLDAGAGSILNMIDELERGIGLGGEPRSAGAVIAGSTEAFSAINRATMAGTQQTDPIARLEAAMRAQETQNAQQLEALRRIQEALESGELFNAVAIR